MEEVILGHLMPDELIYRICIWMGELDRVDAIIRMKEFHEKMQGVWSLVMEDIRANTPLYSLIFEDSNSNICNVNFILPDCDTGRLINMLTLHQTFEEYTLMRGVHRQCLTLRSGSICVPVSQE